MCAEVGQCRIDVCSKAFVEQLSPGNEMIEPARLTLLDIACMRRYDWPVGCHSFRVVSTWSVITKISPSCNIRMQLWDEKMLVANQHDTQIGSYSPKKRLFMYLHKSFVGVANGTIL